MLLWIALACVGAKDCTDCGVDDTASSDDTQAQLASPGCGTPQSAGVTQVTIDAGAQGDGQRGFTLSVPPDYDPDLPHQLVVGYAGTNWVGEQIRPYLDLEEGQANTLFIYPDPLWRDFEGWGNLGGWVLGPNAAPADGMQDLVFTEAALDWMEANYCVDTTRVFATGHSWGGDMAQVVSCFLGERFAASVPVAANRPYWFQERSGAASVCEGDTAVWTLFGEADDHFTWQDYPGQYGDECVEFWTDGRSCDGGEQALDVGNGECVEYTGCSAPVRYCLYGPASRHQVPSYYSELTMDWFNSL